MGKIKSISNQEFGVVLELTEPEARALKAITNYGIKNFKETFYEHLGKTYLSPHEDGLISLFKTITAELPSHLIKFDEARKVFNKKGVN